MQRQWYMQDGHRPPGMLANGIGPDTLILDEMAALRNKAGDVLAAQALELISAAVSDWFDSEAGEEEPYGYAPLLLDSEESRIVSEAENAWYAMEGNAARREELWHQEYLTRLARAKGSLFVVGFDTQGTASRHENLFVLRASHPEITGEDGLELVEGIGFTAEIEEPAYEGLEEGIVAVYMKTRPEPGFESMVARLAAEVDW